MTIRPKIAVGIVVAILAVAGAWVAAASALRQPDTSDYARLDYQRQAVDASMNVYVPVFSGYTADYANVFNEKRSGDEQAAVKAQYVEMLDTDAKVNEDRLAAMRSSIALKDADVKTAFEGYDKAYQAVIDYYRQYALNLAAISEAVAGKCALNENLNVASATLAEDYTKAADACLAALVEAKKTSDDPTKKLLSEVESLVKDRRDAFKRAIGKEGFEQDITRLNALVTLLSINSELKGIQDTYSTTTRTEYTKLVNDANGANEALKTALKPLMGGKETEA